MPQDPTYSENELLEQWAFLDTMVARQAEQLRAGVQDVEDDTLVPVAAPPDTGLQDRLHAAERDKQALALRVSALEGEIAKLKKEIEMREAAAVEGRRRIAELTAQLNDARMRTHGLPPTLPVTEERQAPAPDVRRRWWERR